MRCVFFLLTTILLGFFHPLNGQLPVDHRLHLQIQKTSNSAHIELLGESDMYAGEVTEEMIRMYEIATQEDGEITFELLQLDAEENLEFRLLNALQTSEYFTLRLANQVLTLEEQYDGNNFSQDLGGYQVGDTFHILRCGQKITYTINGQLIYSKALNDNDFELYGEVLVEGPTGMSFEALVTFHPL